MACKRAWIRLVYAGLKVMLIVHTFIKAHQVGLMYIAWAHNTYFQCPDLRPDVGSSFPGVDKKVRSRFCLYQRPLSLKGLTGNGDNWACW